ncbi:MAG TPA: cupin domain-containing protein [Firmicutes bacterium]|nr:cupin domain-containing protein [Bacillota bacterium]
MTPVDVFFYVRSGSGIVTVGDEQAEVSEGDIVLSPKGIPHGLRAHDAGPGTGPGHGSAGPFSVLVVKTPNPERMAK